MGSVTFEENHSPITTYLGKENSGRFVIYYLAALLNRRPDHYKTMKRESIVFMSK